MQQKTFFDWDRHRWQQEFPTDPQVAAGEDNNVYLTIHSGNLLFHRQLLPFT
jgi:hypothetical protein